MKKGLFLTILILFFASMQMANASVYQSWQIDKQMKFNAGYLPQKDLLEKNKDLNAQTPLLKPFWDADVKNINLENFIGMGFDVSAESPKSKKLFIKLFRFPADLNNLAVVQDFFNKFALEFCYDFNNIVTFLTNPENTNVKYCYISDENKVFTPKNPIPEFRTSKSKEFNEYFINHIPFYSLYLLPTDKFQGKSENELAEWSRGGVKGFYKDLLSYYKRNFCELKSDDNDNYYFALRSIDNKELIVIKLPKAPLVFDNWRELPMPQNPKKIFLTSLLLVSSIQYTPVNAKNPDIIPPFNSEVFNSVLKRGKTTVLEIASTVKLK